MYKKILIPVDGSEISDKAFENGVELAKVIGIPVIVAHVVDLGFFAPMASPMEGSPLGEIPVMFEDIKKSSEALLEKKKLQCKELGVHCDAVIKLGHIVDSILQLAKEIEADLVVMGSHGRGRISSVALGSVAYGVIHKAQDVSVLIVR